MPNKILIVDDETDICDVLDIVLKEEGFQTSILTSGKPVYSSVLEDTPDLIIMDIRLGDMDGRDICRKIKESREIAKTPIILISASDNMSDKLDGPGAPDDFVAKPFDIEMLVQTVNRHLA
ncbi:response regulator transcription factor [Mucilaginibacter ginkgonis]|uniref:Response regulator transcription factor n=1 Tax=Mucilaginibacter ginkgonis TaxID=2682091 RepID=A0A6I4HWM5_9SPHI|nr:response regulator transcription factor [Mucilaginibacter ginkgonis]QQL50005.1 response regulator transcription factor [Mucilaginibacter ginkgonis]